MTSSDDLPPNEHVNTLEAAEEAPLSSLPCTNNERAVNPNAQSPSGTLTVKGQFGRTVTDDDLIVPVTAQATEPQVKEPAQAQVVPNTFQPSLPTAKTQLQGGNNEARVPVQQVEAASSNDVSATPLSLLTAKTQLQGSQELRAVESTRVSRPAGVLNPHDKELLDAGASRVAVHRGSRRSQQRPTTPRLDSASSPGAFRVFPNAASSSSSALYGRVSQGEDEEASPTTGSTRWSSQITSVSSLRLPYSRTTSSVPTVSTDTVLNATLVTASTEFSSAAARLSLVRKTLPQATPVDASQLQQQRRRLYYLLAVVALLIVVGVVALATILGTHDDKPPGAQGENRTILVTELSQFLPASLVANMNDTAQAQALAWLATANTTMVAWQMRQRYALAVLYYSWHGDNWVNSTGWLSTQSECSWFFSPEVETRYNTTSSRRSRICNKGRYTRLSLAHNELNGTLSAELALLTDLQALELSENSLRGTIPSELGNLTRLQTLVLEGNALTGSLPTELGQLSLLTGLHLVDNVLTGPLPRQVRNWPNVVVFDVRENLLSGVLPTELAQLSSVEILYVSSNVFTGTLPIEIVHLQHLKDVSVCDNHHHTGTIPTEYGLFPSLEYISITANNKIQGTVPTEFGQISTLQGLYLERTSVTGTIPTEL
jgi:hypothetical protein